MQIGYHKKELLVKLLKTAIFFVVGLLFLIPLFWMLSSSLKTPSEVFARNFKWLPETPIWANYIRVWTDEKVNMTNGFINSAIITVVSIVVALVFLPLKSTFAKA